MKGCLHEKTCYPSAHGSKDLAQNCGSHESRQSFFQRPERRYQIVKLLVYSAYDRVRCSYSPLQLFENEDAAKRAFADLVNDPNSIIAKSPADFSFDCIGLFDITTGEIEQHEDLDFSTERIEAVDLWKEPKDDKITLLLNKIRRLESQISSIQDQLDGGADNE